MMEFEDTGISSCLRRLLCGGHESQPLGTWMDREREGKGVCVKNCHLKWNGQEMNY